MAPAQSKVKEEPISRQRQSPSEEEDAEDEGLEEPRAAELHRVLTATPPRVESCSCTMAYYIPHGVQGGGSEVVCTLFLLKRPFIVVPLCLNLGV